MFQSLVFGFIVGVFIMQINMTAEILLNFEQVALVIANERNTKHIVLLTLYQYVYFHNRMEKMHSNRSIRIFAASAFCFHLKTEQSPHEI